MESLSINCQITKISKIEGVQMKITGYKTYMVPPRWLFLKIETDEGIAGWGEPVIEGKAASVETAVHEFMDQLLGDDPSAIEG